MKDTQCGRVDTAGIGTRWIPGRNEILLVGLFGQFKQSVNEMGQKDTIYGRIETLKSFR